VVAVGADLDRLVEELEALPREQRLQLVKRLERDGFFDDDDQSWYWTPEWQAAEKGPMRILPPAGSTRLITSMTP